MFDVQTGAASLQAVKTLRLLAGGPKRAMENRNVCNKLQHHEKQTPDLSWPTVHQSVYGLKQTWCDQNQENQGFYF